MNPHPRQGRRALLGGAIIIGLAALAAGIFLLDDILARFRAPYQVIAVLPEAPRLAAGSRVWVGGNDVGEVTSVALLPSGGDRTTRVALALQLPGHVRQQVRVDSRVRVTAVNLMGAPVVDIIPGTAATPPLAPGDTLRAGPRLDRTQLPARAASFRAALDSALREMRALQPPVARGTAALERVVRQLGSARAEYERLQRELAASPLLGALGSGELGRSLAQSRATVAELLEALQQVQQRLRASGLSANASAMAERARTLQRSLAELQAEMRERGGTLDRLGRDSALVKAIGAARAELDSLLVDARRNPLRYVF